MKGLFMTDTYLSKAGQNPLSCIWVAFVGINRKEVQSYPLLLDSFVKFCVVLKTTQAISRKCQLKKFFKAWCGVYCRDADSGSS